MYKRVLQLCTDCSVIDFWTSNVVETRSSCGWLFSVDDRRMNNVQYIFLQFVFLMEGSVKDQISEALATFTEKRFPFCKNSRPPPAHPPMISDSLEVEKRREIKEVRMRDLSPVP